MNKPGILTSEFWAMAIPTAVSLLVLTGVVNPGDEEFVYEALRNVVLGMISLGGLIFYIAGRNGLKKAENDQKTVEALREIVEVKEKSNVDAETTLG